MKAQNPNLKAMVAVGGYSPDMVTPWYTLAANSAARQNFARNIREFIARHYLDGVGMYGDSSHKPLSIIFKQRNTEKI